MEGRNERRRKVEGISGEKVLMALKKMKSGESAGFDGVGGGDSV